MIIEGMNEKQAKDLSELVEIFKKDNPAIKVESFTQDNAEEFLKKRLSQLRTLEKSEKNILVVDQVDTILVHMSQNPNKEHPKPANNFAEIRIGDEVNVKGLKFKINYINKGKYRICADLVK